MHRRLELIAGESKLCPKNVTSYGPVKKITKKSNPARMGGGLYKYPIPLLREEILSVGPLAISRRCDAAQLRYFWDKSQRSLN